MLHVSLEQRFHILAWTSLWLYVPPIVWWLTREINNVPLIYAIFIPLSGTLSLVHWTDNHPNSKKHKMDLYVAISLACMLTYRLIDTGRMLVCSCIVTCLMLFFILQRYAQRDKHNNNIVDWSMVTLFHLLFRYFAFWLAMAVHLPTTWPWELYAIVCALLTIIYISHVMYLWDK